ncbi:hypothetical protein HPGCJGGD_4252 [Methylobacterium haplocladii]|nr:hypothetical protein HPGCJGGD_4252 [Methylobacterium haplocladii]
MPEKLALSADQFAGSGSLIAQGQSVTDVIRSLGVTEVTYYRWRKEFGGLKTDQVRRVKDLEIENQRLRKAIADLTLDKLILQEAARGAERTIADRFAAFVKNSGKLEPRRVQDLVRMKQRSGPEIDRLIR